MVVNRAKRHPGELIVINASPLFSKGRPKNELREEHIAEIAALYEGWKVVPQRSAIVAVDEVRANDYQLSPIRYITSSSSSGGYSLAEAVAKLREVETARALADEALWKVLAEMSA
jgi:type I restriction enzyme M protein